MKFFLSIYSPPRLIYFFVFEYDVKERKFFKLILMEVKIEEN